MITTKSELCMMDYFQDHFSRQAELYGKARPTYPEELFRFLASVTPNRNLCWDCATGNGQAAISLAAYFNKVIATDGSARQIQYAQPAPNIVYSVATAEESGLPDQSVDLITVATAAHWFYHDLFYQEVARVARPGAVLALWTYSEAKIEPGIDKLMQWFMYELLEDYWPRGRNYVREQYRTLPFPFDEIKTPEFYCSRQWEREDWLNYLRSWSAYNAYLTQRKSDPLDELLPRLKPLWQNGERKDVVWKLHLRCARL